MPGARRGRVRIDDEIELARKIVDDGKLLGHQQQHVRATERIGLEPPSGEPRLDPPHRVVAEISDQAPAEPGQAGELRDAVARKKFAHESERIGGLGLLRYDVSMHHRHQAPDRPQPYRSCQSNERIAPEALSAHYGLEQIGVGAIGELQIKRERRFEIGKGLCKERNAVETLGGKPLEFCFGHDCSTKTLRRTAGARWARMRLQASCATSASCAIALVSRRFRRARLTYLASRSERLLYNTPARLVQLAGFDTSS